MIKWLSAIIQVIAAYCAVSLLWVKDYSALTAYSISSSFKCKVYKASGVILINPPLL